jgi:hypothetical protein
MSNATQHSRQSGDSRRRRSRGGSRNQDGNPNQSQDGRRSGDRDNRDNRDNRGSGRSEEFHPQSARSPRVTAPVKLSWWQKLLKAIGLSKAPTPPARPERKPQAPRPEAEARPETKSNTRNARTGEGQPAPKTGERSSGPRPERAPRSTDRPRGGDRSTVESPRVYVGNLSYDVSEQDLQELFKGIGGVRNVEIVYNRSTHRSKGYGFVEMLHMDEAMRAVEVLHDQPFMGRKLTVSGAKSKGQDEREDHEERDERSERQSRPVVVAPRPASAAPQSEVEPEIQTIVETVHEAPAEEIPVVAEAAPVATETPAESEAKSEIV